MYFAQLDDEGKSFKCYVAEEIIVEDDIVYSSEMEKEVDEFCEKWNRALKDDDTLDFIKERNK
ncbi:hypothetical protein PZQ55_002067 [Clostridium botulinum]|nr:hypothetical protein [Clostridium botulinum]EKO2043070.1 hypothetical protein [Clostridium botulinum]